MSMAPPAFAGPPEAPTDLPPDVAAYQELYGVSQADAARQMSEAARIGELEAELASRFPAAFAGLWIDHQPYGVTVAVRADVDRGALATAFERVNLTVTPTVRVVDRSFKELEVLLERVLQAAGLPKVDAEIDVRTNEVVIYSVQTLGADDMLATGMADTAGVRLEVVPQLSQPATLIYGGLGGDSLGWSGCPSGFIVRILEGAPPHYTYGYVSAGHCGNIHSYQGVNLPFRNQCVHDNCDSQWHTLATFSPVPEFVYQSNQARRQVRGTISRANLVVGSLVCKYGPVTLYTCGDVKTKTWTPNWIESPNPTFIRAQGACSVKMVEQGDSGGPVFNGNYAIGITSGYFQDIVCEKQLVFNSIDMAAGPLGVSVWLAP
jgi:hypothetical protein